MMGYDKICLCRFTYEQTTSNFAVAQKLTELRRFLILTFVVTSWPWPLTLKRNSDGAATKIHLWTNFGEDIKGSRVIRDLIKRRTNRQTDRQTVKPTYLPNLCEILASNYLCGTTQLARIAAFWEKTCIIERVIYTSGWGNDVYFNTKTLSVSRLI